MENIRIKLIRLFNESGSTVDLPAIESIAELFYMHQGDLEEERDRLRTRNDEMRREISALQTSNSELSDMLLEVSIKYAEALVLATEQFTVETRLKEKEAREKKIVGEDI